MDTLEESSTNTSSTKPSFEKMCKMYQRYEEYE
jgi:hypothetical protein